MNTEGTDPGPSHPWREAMHRALVVGLCALPVLTACSSSQGERRPPRDMPHRMVEGQPMYDVLPRDGIPAIDEVSFVSAAQAEVFMRADEPVIGLVSESGEARCYSTWHLDSHEIVNDDFDGRPIAVTW